MLICARHYAGCFRGHKTMPFIFCINPRKYITPPLAILKNTEVQRGWPSRRGANKSNISGSICRELSTSINRDMGGERCVYTCFGHPTKSSTSLKSFSRFSYPTPQNSLLLWILFSSCPVCDRWLHRISVWTFYVLSRHLDLCFPLDSGHQSPDAWVWKHS